MKKLLLLSALALAGCAGERPAPRILTQTVEKPVAVSCVPDNLAPTPVYPDTRQALLAAPTFDQRYKLMTEGWGLRDERLYELEVVIAGCLAGTTATLTPAP